MTKGLLALEKICNNFPLNSTSGFIIPIEKELKALEIMTKYDLKKSNITRFNNYDDFIKTMYLGIDGVVYDEHPSKEEFDLLKEVLL